MLACMHRASNLVNMLPEMLLETSTGPSSFLWTWRAKLTGIFQCFQLGMSKNLRVCVETVHENM